MEYLSYVINFVKKILLINNMCKCFMVIGVEIYLKLMYFKKIGVIWLVFVIVLFLVV